MTTQLGPEQVGTPPAPDVYLVRVREGWLLRAVWRWAAWDGRGWSAPQAQAGDASRLLGADGRIPERMYARGALSQPSRWRRIESQGTVVDALRGAGGA